MSRNVIKPLDDSENIVKPQQNTAADVVRSPSDYASSVIRPDYASAVAAENRYIQHGGDGQDRSIEEQRRANETLDSIKFDNDIDLDMEKTREQLGFKDAAQPQTAADIFKAARDKAARINGDADRQQPEQQQKKDRNTERGE